MGLGVQDGTQSMRPPSSSGPSPTHSTSASLDLGHPATRRAWNYDNLDAVGIEGLGSPHTRSKTGDADVSSTSTAPSFPTHTESQWIIIAEGGKSEEEGIPCTKYPRKMGEANLEGRSEVEEGRFPWNSKERGPARKSQTPESCCPWYILVDISRCINFRIGLFQFGVRSAGSSFDVQL